MTFKGWTRSEFLWNLSVAMTNWRYWAAPVISMMTGSLQRCCRYIVAVGDETNGWRTQGRSVALTPDTSGP